MKGHKRPSWATLIALAALVLSLCGSALAGTPERVSNLISGSDIKPRSQPANRIVKNTITGKQVNEAKLGAVPLVARATSADQANSATTADTAPSAVDANTVDGVTAAELKTRCKPGTILLAGGCVETGPPRTADNYISAAITCASRALPTVPQLQALAALGGLTGNEWTGTVEVPSAALVVNVGTNAIGVSPITTSIAYRCVGTPLN